MTELRLQKGALITCSNSMCGEIIGRLSQDLKIGDNRLGFEKDFGQGTRLDKLPHCKVCNHRYFVSDTDLARIHTTRGWYPTEQQMINAFNA